MNQFRVETLTQSHARKILGWRYSPPLDFYNPPTGATAQANVLPLFLDPKFCFQAIVEADGELAGFASFGEDGQIPGGDYTLEAVDIGLGMRPDLVGLGHGSAFFDTIVRFAIDDLGARQLRLTVADFNHRAMALYVKFGFQATQWFNDTRDDVSYTVLCRGANS